MGRLICSHPAESLIVNQQFAICQKCDRLFRSHHPLYRSLMKRHSIQQVRRSLIAGHRELQEKLGTTDIEVLGAYVAKGADLTA